MTSVSTLAPPGAHIRPEAPVRPRFDRYAVRALSRRLVAQEPGCKALSQCGLPISEAVAGPGLILTENGRMVGGQLVACRSPLRCAWCSPMQWRIAEETGLEYMRRHEEAGGWVAATTFTIPHARSDRLTDSLGALFQTWSGIRKHRPIVRAKKDVGVLTALSVLQVKWSERSGWHPHLHVAWLCMGDVARAESLIGSLQSGWQARASTVTGRSASPVSGQGMVAFTSLGFWKYCKPDDPLHPKNDCLHPDHAGCGMCTTQEDPLDGSPVGPGPLDDSPVVGEGGPVGGLEILSGVGVLAAEGSARHQAVLAEYLTGMAGYRRIPSTFREVAKIYGEVSPPNLWSSPAGGGPRVWVHPALAAEVELHRRPDGPSLDWGIANAVRNPDGTARAWAEHLDRPVEVVTHPNDGAPVLGFPKDVDGKSPSMQAAQGAESMSNTMNNEAIEARLGLANILVSRLGVKEHRNALLDAMDKEGKDKATIEGRETAEGLHELVVELNDPGLLADYEKALHAYISDANGFPSRVIAMAVEVNTVRAADAGSVTPPPPPAPSMNGEKASA